MSPSTALTLPDSNIPDDSIVFDALPYADDALTDQEYTAAAALLQNVPPKLHPSLTPLPALHERNTEVQDDTMETDTTMDEKLRQVRLALCHETLRAQQLEAEDTAVSDWQVRLSSQEQQLQQIQNEKHQVQIALDQMHARRQEDQANAKIILERLDYQKQQTATRLGQLQQAVMTTLERE